MVFIITTRAQCMVFTLLLLWEVARPWVIQVMVLGLHAQHRRACPSAAPTFQASLLTGGISGNVVVGPS